LPSADRKLSAEGLGMAFGVSKPLKEKDYRRRLTQKVYSRNWEDQSDFNNWKISFFGFFPKENLVIRHKNDCRDAKI
jgi:hypothetical protein